MTIQRAFALLGLQGNPSAEEIHAAFRSCVRAAADGHGGYSRDMDALVQAKACLLAARALDLEQEERRRRHALGMQEMAAKLEQAAQEMEHTARMVDELIARVNDLLISRTPIEKD